MNIAIPEFATSNFDEGFTPEDAETKALYKEVGAFAKQGQPVVIFGPTGAGKEFLARHYYKTFVNTEFYKQYEESWPSKYNEIKKLYSLHYSGQSLDIFLSSLKAGIFQSINSATIYPNLAESILFGHEANAFTGALTSPGLLESIKYGVLFMDEVGELSKNLQAKLLRAVDSEINQGRRISGKMDYSLKDIIIISATNQPRDMIRDDFYYKIGIEVEIKGIDERPKDVVRAIPYFISRAIGKRKDYAAVINMFGISGIQNINRLSETGEVKNFAGEMSGLVTDEILKRKWPGNFRALRRAIESAVLRIESPHDIKNFSQEFRRNLHYYIAKYSVDRSKTSVLEGKSLPGTVYPSLNPDMDRRILEEIENKNVFRDMDDFEKNLLAVFLSSTFKTGFKRRDLEEYYKKHEAIRYTSEAHIRSKINKLMINKILVRTGNNKSIRYSMTKSFRNMLDIKKSDVFSTPDINKNWSDRGTEIDALDRVLHTTDRLYIQAPQRYGKTAFISMFCKAMENRYNFYYYPLGEQGICKMLEDILNLLQSEDIVLNSKELPDTTINSIHPFLGNLFKTKDNIKPVLIIDNANYISDTEGINTIADLAKKWKEVILILIGNTMDNALLEDFHEFPLGPWGKEA